MIRSYLPALVFLGLGATLGLVFTFVNSLLGNVLRRDRARTGEFLEAHDELWPPSTAMHWPVMWRAAFDARKAMSVPHSRHFIADTARNYMTQSSA